MAAINKWFGKTEVFRAQRTPGGEMELHRENAPAPYVPPGSDAVPVISEPPDWAVVKPEAHTEFERYYANAVLPIRLVLIGLLWTFSSWGRTAIVAGAVLVIVILLRVG